LQTKIEKFRYAGYEFGKHIIFKEKIDLDFDIDKLLEFRD